MHKKEGSKMGWPSHGRSGRHDWWTYLERGYAEPFREAVREMDDVDVAFEGPGRTMLMYAVGSTVEIVKILIEAGADVNRKDSSGRPVWDFAPTSGPASPGFWRALIEAGLDVRSRGQKNETPLMMVSSVYLAPATDRPHLLSVLSVIQMLLDAGAEVNVLDCYNETPLRAASGIGNIEVVKVLLKAGADPNLLGNGTRSALFEAALKGHGRVVQALLQAGARVDAATLGCRIRSFPVFTSGYEDAEGVTPLIAAAEGGYLQAVRLLVEAGADLNRPDASGFTPLMGAARSGNAGMVRFLLERGARVDAIDAHGRDARRHAVEFQHQREIVPILDQARNRDVPD